MPWYNEAAAPDWHVADYDTASITQDDELPQAPEQVGRSEPTGSTRSEPATIQGGGMNQRLYGTIGSKRRSRLTSIQRGVKAREDAIKREILADSDRDYWIKLGVVSETAAKVAPHRRGPKFGHYHRVVDTKESLLQAWNSAGGSGNTGGVPHTNLSLQVPQLAADHNSSNNSLTPRTLTMTPSLVSDNSSSPTKSTAFDKIDALSDELCALQCAEREFKGFAGTSKGFLKAQAVQLDRLGKSHSVRLEDTPHHGEKGLRVKFDKAKEVMLWQEYMQTDVDGRKDLQKLMEMTTTQFDSCYGRAKKEYTDIIDGEFFPWYQEHLANEFKTKGKEHSKDFYDQDSDYESAFGTGSDEEDDDDEEGEEETKDKWGKDGKKGSYI